MKIKLIAEIDALIQLSYNTGFVKGGLLKFILKNTSDIILIMDDEELNNLWSDSESDLRKFCDSYDIPRPKADSEIKEKYLNPVFCYQHDPFAIWLLNRPHEVLSKFKDYLGLWAISPKELSDDFFCLDHKRVYSRSEFIEGPKDNGWGNLLTEIPKSLPPMNSIVINDRFLLLNENERLAEKSVNWGLKNLKALFEELLPRSLKVPFHILILCQHPKLCNAKVNEKVQHFITEIQNTRDYDIKFEYIYGKSKHNRGLYSNYFLIFADRAFSAFYAYNLKQLNGENIFSIKSYLNNPFSTGDTDYEFARKILKGIKEECIQIITHPTFESESESPKDIAEAYTDCDDFFYNRLFSEEECS